MKNKTVLIGSLVLNFFLILTLMIVSIISFVHVEASSYQQILPPIPYPTNNASTTVTSAPTITRPSFITATPPCCFTITPGITTTPIITPTTFPTPITTPTTFPTPIAVQSLVAFINANHITTTNGFETIDSGGTNPKLGWTLQSNSSYTFEFIIGFTTSNTTNGVAFSIDAPTGATMIYRVGLQSTLTSTEGFISFNERIETIENKGIATPSLPQTSLMYAFVKGQIWTVNSGVVIGVGNVVGVIIGVVVIPGVIVKQHGGVAVINEGRVIVGADVTVVDALFVG